jgi:anti-sigma regulatory factor (Ser/Thr protein kinase)
MLTGAPKPARIGRSPWSARIWRLPLDSAERRARVVLREVLAEAELPDDDIADMELVAAELAANGVRHARPPYELRVLYAGAGRRPVWCEIVDAEPELGRVAECLRESGAQVSPGEVEDLDALIANLSLSGRGLTLVRGLTAGRCAAYPTTTCTVAGTGKAIGFALPW